MDDTDRREFFRIQDVLELSFRLLDPGEVDHVRRSGLFVHRGRIGGRLKNVLKKHAFRDEEGQLLGSFLIMLDEKLSAIMDLLTEAKTDESFTTCHGGVEISGSGLSFSSQVPLLKGDHLELRIQLPVHPYPLIPALCEVVNSAEEEHEGARVCRVACRFVAIADADRDALVNYIFMRERETIRLRKGKRE